MTTTGNLGLFISTSTQFQMAKNGEIRDSWQIFLKNLLSDKRKKCEAKGLETVLAKFCEVSK